MIAQFIADNIPIGFVVEDIYGLLYSTPLLTIAGNLYQIDGFRQTRTLWMAEVANTMRFSLELRQLGRFFSVGLVAAATHLGVALGLITFFAQPALTANALGFLLAVNVSFFGHYHFSFRSSARKTPAYAKFFATTATAMLANNLLLVYLLQLNVNDIIAVLLANLIIPVVTYLVSRFWIFK